MDGPEHGIRLRQADRLRSRRARGLRKGRPTSRPDDGSRRIRQVGRGSGSFTLPCLSSDEFVDYTDQTSTGTKMPRTSRKTMGQYKIWLPSDKVAHAFQSLAQPLLDCSSANVHEARSLAQTRDLLLPKLMSGEIRLTEAEKAVKAVA